MARLNEPAPPAAESIDALKRRFVRQNRELARINSNQSVRIRNLENEISRLLSENIAFRERLIKLQHEADRSPGQAAFDQVAVLRSQLEEKLADIGSVVKELGNVQGETRKAARRKSIKQTSPQRSPDQRNWKNALSLSEVTGMGDGRLPPIFEDKYYPRRTLESEELRNILDAANTLDSPDLGPPPVASWEEQDPVKTDAEAASPIRQPETGTFNNMEMPSLANLETRKKRRESTHQAGIKPSESQTSQRAVEGKVQLQPLRAGAKRKLHVRDDEGETNEEKPLEDNDFSSNEANNKAMNKTAEALVEASTGLKITHDQSAKIAEQTKENKAASFAPDKPRKALGAKSVNTDPLKSPAKLNRATVGQKLKDNHVTANGKPKDLHRPSERPQSRNRDRPWREQQPSKPSATSTIPVLLEPETPVAPVDIFSPHSSESSIARPDSRDTPPPPHLDPGASIPDTFGMVEGRARRARGSVSYAEPSLRDKMRRPTKELVDAVAADERPQIVKLQDAKANPETERLRTGVVKTENSEEWAYWKDLPLASDGGSHQSSARAETTSPLGQKSLNAATKDLPATVMTDRRRRDSLVCRNGPQGEQIKPATASGTAIAALVAGTQKARSHDVEPAAKSAKESKDIFELGSSSPADGGTVAVAAPTRTSRRHSSISSIQVKHAGKAPNSSVARRKERIRQTLANVVSNNDEDSASSKGAKSVNVLAEGEIGRAERAVNRRRSMII